MTDLSQYNGLTLGADISVDEIKSALNASVVRVATPNSALILNYILTRITIHVDYNNVIKKIVWG